jgi:hypothetical protein
MGLVSETLRPGAVLRLYMITSAVILFIVWALQ